MSIHTDFGNGSLGTVAISDGATEKINSYARVVAIGESSLTIDKDSVMEGDFEKFVAGNEIMFHVTGSPSENEYLGKYCLCKILLVQDNILTVDKDITGILPTDKLQNYYAQIITVAQFRNLTLLEGGIITPPVYNPFKYCGGILAVKCSERFTMNGGQISLSDSGIPVARKKILRPLVEQETEAVGQLDSAAQAGYENYITDDRLLVNAGDGAIYLVAKEISVKAGSRIGNLKTHGVSGSRGAADSERKPSKVTNIGGSTILLACEKIYGFSPAMIAKYRTMSNSVAEEGRGLARCLIASEELLPFDDKLYHAEILSDRQRLMKHNIMTYGSGEKEIENPTYALNNYADIIYFEDSRIVVENLTVKGYAPLVEGALVLIRAEKDFRFSRVLAVTGEEIYLDARVPEKAYSVVTVPEVGSLTLSGEYNRYLAALARDKVDLRNATVDGGIICAKKIILNDATRFSRQAVLIADEVEGLSAETFSAAESLVLR